MFDASCKNNDQQVIGYEDVKAISSRCGKKGTSENTQIATYSMYTGSYVSELSRKLIQCSQY